MTPEEFCNRWANTELGEKQIAQTHFLDVCKLVGVEMPTGAGKTQRGETFVFEQSLRAAAGHGFADVYYENHFAIEYKSPDKYADLNAAYEQLQRYRENLKNPPLLVVTDINHWEIHTNFPNTEKRVYRFSHNEIAASNEVLGWLRAMFHAPERLHPGRNTEQVTKEAADAFQLIADNMRGWDAEPTRIAYFLTKLVFCLFAEDVGLLPAMSGEPQGVFSYIVEHSRGKPGAFKQYIQNLFVAMNEGGSMFMRDIPYFNGTLFKFVSVEALQVDAIEELAKAAQLNWEAIEPSIFGTLFERSLDPNKRSQRGAHYTSRDDILLIVEPVLMQPLRAEWAAVQSEAQPIRQRYDLAETGRAKTKTRNRLLALRERILKRVRETTVLDPACGSGNFLYVSLQMLMDLEKEVILHPLWAGLQMATREVHPRQMYGIEIDPIAHALASIVVWIGYIQWRINNGYGQEFGEPILEELEDNIVCKDAILPPRANPPQSRHRDGGKAVTRPQTAAVDWPAVDVIVGNPPFLGAKKQRIELSDEYVDRLRDFYKGRIPAFVDFACYWFENAREQIDKGRAKRAGLLATNSIRDGMSRLVLQRIKESGDIFMAWSDREWVLDGAAVRISMVGFDSGAENVKTLDGHPVATIHSNLTTDIDLTHAVELAEDKGISFLGPQKDGPLDIPYELAIEMLNASNPSGLDNRDVVKPYRNSADLVRTLRNFYIIDFHGFSVEEARGYEAPFKYVEEFVKPVREKNRERQRRENWWRLGRSGDDYRNAVRNVYRQIFTPLTSKHRIYVWQDILVFPGSTTVAIARDDDYFFGVLHSTIHESWAMRTGSTLGPARRYTPTTTFETFPFPWPPGQEDESHPAHAAISATAKQLHEERDAWLNPHPPAPSPKMREGEQSRVKWDIPPELERRMQAVAREFRKNPTVAEDVLWQAIRKRQLDGRKFRRQVAIGAFVVDFYCSTERLAVEVDGPIHAEQQESDRIRQELIESLGIRFVRLANEKVELDLESALDMIRNAFVVTTTARGDYKPLPLDGGGVWGGGEKALKDRTLTNLYNALAVFRGRDSMRTKPAAADFAPRLDQLHRELDEAVCAAYGWGVAILDDEEAMLRRLLALNLERAAQSG